MREARAGRKCRTTYRAAEFIIILLKDKNKKSRRNHLDEKPSFNTNSDLLVLHYNVTGYSTGT